MGGKIHRNSLKPGHKILWYEIKEILGQGGFGITVRRRNLLAKELLDLRDTLVHQWVV
jgi:hypothetical protein